MCRDNETIVLHDSIALPSISNGYTNFLIGFKTLIKSNDFEVKNIKSLLKNTRVLNTSLAWIAGGSKRAEHPQRLSNYILFYVP